MADDELISFHPIADEEQTERLHNIIRQAATLKQLRKGSNESVKAINRGLHEFVVMAADCEPASILTHLPTLCQDKKVPHIYVASKSELGGVCGVVRQVIACCIVKKAGSPIEQDIARLKEEIINMNL